MIMDRKRKKLKNATEHTSLTCLFFRHDFRIWKLRKFAAVLDQFLCAKVQSILMPPYFARSGDGTRQIVIFKHKLSQSGSMQLQVAINIFYDLMMQCLHCLRNVHDRITPIVCRQMISC